MKCEICKNDFESYRNRKQRFCSKECRKKYHTLDTRESRKKLTEKEILERRKQALDYYYNTYERRNLTHVRNKMRKTNLEHYYRNKNKILKQGSKRLKEYRKNNPLKYRSQNQANKNIKIPKGQICQICEKRLATTKHHDDYSKPLEVIFCCKICHYQLDLQRRLRENGR